MERLPDRTDSQTRCSHSTASSLSTGPSRPSARSTPRPDEHIRTRSRREDERRENVASKHLGHKFSHSSTGGNAKAHFGDHYGNVYNYDGGYPLPYASCVEHDQDAFAQIMESLSFVQMDVRRDTISRAHMDTCRWLFNRPEYIDWRNADLMHDHYGFFWIKSKPGAGKSTLMKFVLQTANKHLPEDWVISFFFNARGEDLEKSLEGCYRSLLHQLLTKLPRLRRVLEHLKTPSSSRRQWSLACLKSLLSEAISQLVEERLTFFIDALDECPEDEIRDMIDFFEELGALATEESIHLRVCFSSRHYPQVTISNCQHMNLDAQEGHQQDIWKYVKSKLKVRKGKTAEEIRVAVQEKAQGVFMWVVLVVRILNEESDHGGNNADLRKCLDQIPSKLHELFRDILQRGMHDDRMLIPMLQWISFARRPLTREELYYAIRSGQSDFTPTAPWNPIEDSLEAMDLFILNSSKGLAELTKGTRPKVQFIHESVRDYLRDTGFGILAPSLSGSLQGLTHDYIKRCCYRWISEEMNRVLALPERLPKVSDVKNLRKLRDAASEHFPFLEYSVTNLVHHAELACCNGVSQECFVEEFRWSPWVRINALFARYERCRYTAPANTLSYVFAAQKAQALLKIELRLRSHRLEPPQLEAALRIALINHDTETFTNILDSGHTRGPFQLTELLVETAVKVQNMDALRMIFERGMNTKPLGLTHSLYEAAGTGNVDILRFLFDQGAAGDGSYLPLFAACRRGHERASLILIEHGANVNYAFDNGMTPLVKACIYGHHATAKTLIECGAHINPEHALGLTALTQACQFGHETVVKMLLELGANPNLTAQNQETPLLQACSAGYEGVVRILLSHGINLEARNDSGETALSRACVTGHGNIACMLLEKGADVNLPLHVLEQSLAALESNDHASVVRVLLEPFSDLHSCRRESVLVSASAQGFDNILRRLFRNGIDANVRNGRDYFDALSTASLNGNTQVVKTLLANSIGVQHQDPDNYREVVQALTMGRHVRVLELLLDESDGFDAQEKSIYRGPLRQAKQLGFVEIETVLRRRGVTLPEDTST
jgi:ankyrin repeat protein